MSPHFPPPSFTSLGMLLELRLPSLLLYILFPFSFRVILFTSAPPFNLIPSLQVFPVLPPLTSHCLQSVSASRSSSLAWRPCLCVPSSSILFEGLFLCSSPFCILTGVVLIGVFRFPSVYANVRAEGVDDGVTALGLAGPSSQSASSVGGARHSHSAASGNSAADTQDCSTKPGKSLVSSQTYGFLASAVFP